MLDEAIGRILYVVSRYMCVCIQTMQKVIVVSTQKICQFQRSIVSVTSDCLVIIQTALSYCKGAQAMGIQYLKFLKNSSKNFMSSGGDVSNIYQEVDMGLSFTCITHLCTQWLSLDSIPARQPILARITFPTEAESCVSAFLDLKPLQQVGSGRRWSCLLGQMQWDSTIGIIFSLRVPWSLSCTSYLVVVIYVLMDFRFRLSSDRVRLPGRLKELDKEQETLPVFEAARRSSLVVSSKRQILILFCILQHSDYHHLFLCLCHLARFNWRSSLLILNLRVLLRSTSALCHQQDMNMTSSSVRDNPCILTLERIHVLLNIVCIMDE